jgi:hypothetical protein
MKDGKFKKLNISLPPDLHGWIKKKQADFKRENPLGKLEISPIVAHCIKAMKESEESPQISSSKASKVSPVVGATMATLSENLDSGPSTATKKHCRRAS